MKKYVSKRVKSSAEEGYPASWTRNNFIDYLLQSDDNFIVLDEDGACKYCCLPVTTENFNLTDKMVKQFKEDGVYGDYIGGVLWGSKPYSAEVLPTYGRSDRYVTKWFCEDKADAIKESLSDRNMALLKRANAYLNSNITSATKIKSYTCITGTWQMLDHKSVPDFDGFNTDYTLYTDNAGKYICMFGDNEAYEPDENYADWEGYSEAEAYEWFDSYEGLVDDDHVYSATDLPGTVESDYVEDHRGEVSAAYCDSVMDQIVDYLNQEGYRSSYKEAGLEGDYEITINTRVGKLTEVIDITSFTGVGIATDAEREFDNCMMDIRDFIVSKDPSAGI